MNDLFALAETQQTSTRQVRSRQIEPDLVSSRYSKEWAFKMPQAFRSALDINLTTVVENSVPTQAWTQGQSYDFNVGDTVYDTEAAYELPWVEAIGKMKTCIQVLAARKASPSAFTTGEVEFQALHPVNGKLVPAGNYKGTQSEFVSLLKTGTWNGIEHHQL